MGYSYNAAGPSFPGLWPALLFGNDPYGAVAGFPPLPNAQPFFGNGDSFGLGGFGQQNMYAMMQQQLLAQFMLQSMISLLVDYFAQQLNQRGGCGCGRSVGALGGGNNWGGGRQVPWSPRPGGGGAGGSKSYDPGATDGPRSQGQRGIPDGLRQNAANGARVVREMGFGGTIGGLGERSHASDHPHGNAIDVMTQRDTNMGRQVAENFRQNHDQLGVKYVIYQQQIASPRTGWQWRPMEDRGSPTANHMDHVHISFH